MSVRFIKYLSQLCLFSTLAIVATGCADKPAAPPIGAIPVITSADQLKRPIGSWLPTADQVRIVLRATDIVTAQCMRRYGFDYKADNIGIDTTAIADRGDIFGFFNPPIAEKDGYDAVVIAEPSRAAFQSGESVVLSGREDNGAPVNVYAGQPLPTGGCHQLAQNTVGAAPPLNPQGLPGGGPQVPLDDPRLVAATKAWSACMKSAGFNYSSPVEAFLDPRWRTRESGIKHTHLEISVATSDSDCKILTSFMGTVVALEKSYDQLYMNGHMRELEAFRKSLNDQVSRADHIIASNDRM